MANLIEAFQFGHKRVKLYEIKNIVPVKNVRFLFDGTHVFDMKRIFLFSGDKKKFKVLLR